MGNRTNMKPECTEEVRMRSHGDTLSVTITVMAGLAAAWAAGGSLGLLAHPLRRALVMLLLCVACVAGMPSAENVAFGHSRSAAAYPRLRMLLILAFGFGAALYLVSLPLAPANVMASAIILLLIAHRSPPWKRDVLLACSTAVVVFGLYRFAVASVPWFWLAADFVGRNLGRAAGVVTQRPVWVGATFGGLDFLVLTVVVWNLCLPFRRARRTARAIYGFVGILGGHLLYLVLLSYVPDLLATLPPPAHDGAGAKPMSRLFHQAAPWNLPVIACAVHLAIIAMTVRWSAWTQDYGKRSQTTGTNGTLKPVLRSPRVVIAVEAAVFAMAVALPAVSILHLHPLSLTGKKIVFYEKGFLNWLKPAHDSYGRLSSGMYGMLPVFLESVGARPLISPDLSEDDLKDADVLVLIFPDDPWQEGQLSRIHDFVLQGGSLLVLGEHTTEDKHGGNRFNEVLAPTKMQVQFDSATFAVGGWLHSYEALSHPMTAGIADDQNQFGVVIGASLTVKWPARPILIGRWGWADFGDEASSRAMMGNDRYDGGEKLGDVVLAAEQPLGKGRIVTLGDTSGLTNAINVSSYVFTSRLFASMVGSPAHGALRQSVVLLATALLVGALCRRPTLRRTVLVAMGLAVSLTLCTTRNHRHASLLPDGRKETPNNLAYIDTSHVGRFSHESWRPDGIGGLILTLMRNGYLALTLPDVTSERLDRAGLLVSIAPSRSFSRDQVEAVKGFVNRGGTLIMIVGHDEVEPSRPLLAAFDLRVGLDRDKTMEPEPMGHFKAPYLESAGKRVYVRFHAAWPVACDDPASSVMAYGKGNRPVVVMRRFGAGKVLLIGDTCFAMNKNLEWENGAPFEGLRENADFWRWLLCVLREQPMWIPPALQDANPETGTAEEMGS